MEFFDKVKKVASDVANVSEKQGKKLYGVTKIKLEIAEKQSKVKNLYKEIGFDAYKAHKAKADIAEYIKGKLEEIDAFEEEIAILRKREYDIKNVQEVDDDTDMPFEDNAETVEADLREDFDEDEAEPIEPIE